MARYPKTSEETVNKIIELYQGNVKTKEICEMLNISKATVHREIRKYKDEMKEAEEMLKDIMGEEEVKDDNVNHPKHYHKQTRY